MNQQVFCRTRAFTVTAVFSLVLYGGCLAPLNMIPPGPPVQIEFQSKAAERALSLEIRDAEGQRKSCVTPCTTALASGTAQVLVVDGNRRFERFPFIPYQPAPLTAIVNTNRRWHWYLGISLITLGMVTLTSSLGTPIPEPTVFGSDGEPYITKEAETRFFATVGTELSTGLGLSIAGLVLVFSNARNDRIDVRTTPAPRVPQLGRRAGSAILLPGAEYLALDATEATVAAYEHCVHNGGCTAAGTGPYCNSGRFGRGKHPINCIDRKQARAYCKAAGKRLPTDVEWQQAAQLVERQVAHFQRHEIGWEPGTYRVASPPNPSGLHDLFGNVWEWVDGGAVGLTRGGGWDTREPSADAALEPGVLDPLTRSPAVGVRCIQDSAAVQP